MKRKNQKSFALIIIILSVILTLVLLACAFNTPAHAADNGWSASQTVTVEPGNTIYTTCIEYDFTEAWVANFTLDYDVLYGTAYDLSTTFYIPFKKEIYSTAGVRYPSFSYPGKRNLIPYLSVTYRF